MKQMYTNKVPAHVSAVKRVTKGTWLMMQTNIQNRYDKSKHPKAPQERPEGDPKLPQSTHTDLYLTKYFLI